MKKLNTAINIMKRRVWQINEILANAVRNFLSISLDAFQEQSKFMHVTLEEWKILCEIDPVHHLSVNLMLQGLQSFAIRKGGKKVWKYTR